jgi:zinc protease
LEVQRALTEGFSAAEVEREKQVWRDNRRRFVQNEDLLAGRIAQGFLTEHDFHWLANYDRQIAALTPGEVTAAFRKYVGAAPIVWSAARGAGGGS